MDTSDDLVDNVIESASNMDNELSPVLNQETSTQQDTGESIIEPNPEQIDEGDDNENANGADADDHEAIKKAGDLDGGVLEQADESSLFDLDMPAIIDNNPVVPLQPDESLSSSSLPDGVPEPGDPPLDDTPQDAVLGLDDLPDNAGEEQESAELPLDQPAGQDDGVAVVDDLLTDAGAEVEGVDDLMTGQDDALVHSDSPQDVDDSLGPTEEEKPVELVDDANEGDDHVHKDDEKEADAVDVSDDGDNPADVEEDDKKEATVDEESLENNDDAALGEDTRTKAQGDIDTETPAAPPSPTITPVDTVNLDSDGDSRDAVVPVPGDADKASNSEHYGDVIVPGDEGMEVDEEVDEKQDDSAMDVEITDADGSKKDGHAIGGDDKNSDDIMVLDAEPVNEKTVKDTQSKLPETDNGIVVLDSESVAEGKIVNSKDDKPADVEDVVDLDSEFGDEKREEPEQAAETKLLEDIKTEDSKELVKKAMASRDACAGGDSKLKNGEILSGESLSKVVNDENNDSGLKIVAVSTGVKKEKIRVDQVQIKNEIDDALADIRATEQKKADLSKIQTCIVCQLITKCKYNIVRNGDIKHLCDDACFKQFRRTPTRFLRTADPAPISMPVTVKTTAAPDISSFKTCCVCQLLSINKSSAFISWMGNNFCGVGCQQKFKANLGTCCCYCATYIPLDKSGKFCLRVGNEVRPFCSDKCLQEKKARMKICTNCKKDLAGDSDAFVAPIGNNSEFKDFCTPECLTAYEEKLKKGLLIEKKKPVVVPKADDNDIEILKVQPGDGRKTKMVNNCAVCGKMTNMKHELKYEGKLHQMCSDPCLSAFQYAHKLNASTCRCETCGQMCFREGAVPKFIQFEGQQRRFCSSKCIMNFHEGHKKTVSCAWCGTRKYNFDMIERLDANNKFQLFCSLNCLSLYRVNLQATSNNMIPCDQCHKQAPAQYHLTMSDASVRNFCTYPCVMNFQTHFNASNAAGKGKTVVTGTKTGQAPVHKVMTSQPIVNKAAIAAAQAVSTSKMVTRGGNKKVPNTVTLPVVKVSSTAQASSSLPMISNVISLAPQGAQGKAQTVTIRSPTGQVPVVVTSQPQQIKTTINAKAQQVQQQIIIQPPPPKPVKNKALLCKPFVQTKATSCRPHVQTKETQTDTVPLEKMLIPIPVPFFIPTPMAMYAIPTPIPLPFPIPIPVPVFIPTTKKNGPTILKHIKEIREKIPSDPLEAEMLRMAEAVASDKKESDSSSGSEDEDKEPENAMTQSFDNPEQASASPSDYLKGVDLETTVGPASVVNNNGVVANQDIEAPAAAMSDDDDDNLDQIDMLADGDDEDDWTPEPPTTRASPRRATPPSKSRTRRPPKRTSSSVGRRRSKRSRVGDDTPPDLEPAADSPTLVPTPAVAPDAGLALKYTYGVNAWKNWVTVKNSQIEKTPRSSKAKKFKTDLLHCTSDELNYSLRLFVNEVRKPNGDTYAGDSIFYLCLGIQQYLYENGRIDNIFTDQCYSDFSNSLNDHVIQSVPRVNPAGQLVCRIEEEHLWESKQLGAHSPNILLNTLVYFNTKYFMLKTVQEHNDLGFLHILKHWRKTETPQGIGRAVYLRFYCTTAQKELSDSTPGKGRKKDEVPVFEQTESFDNPLRCPVKLYEFYLSKCPEGVKLRKDMFYLVPERSCVPDSPVWFSTGKLDSEYLAKLLNRVLMVKEVQEAHLSSKPVYISIKN